MEKLKDLCKCISDGEHGSVADDLCGKYFLLSNKNLVNNVIEITDSDRRINKETYYLLSRKQNLEKGDLLLSTVGTVGKTQVLEEPGDFVFQRSVGIIKTKKDKLNPYYLKYLFETSPYKKLLSNLAHGGVQKGIYIYDIGNIPIDCLSLEKQEELIRPLLTIDRKISLNNKINDNLSQQLQLLFDFWFKQYNFANSIGKPYALSNGSFIYNDKLKRKIPENWIIGSLMNNPLSKPIEPGVSYFNCKNYLATANINRTAITDGENVAFENRESRANMEPRLYSIWFAKMKNSIKHLFISGKGQDIVEKYILSTGFAGINCDEKTFAYMAGVISDPTFELVKDKYAHGATQQSVNNDDLDLYKIVIPDSKTLEKYAALANPLYEKLNLLQIENNKLQKLRDYLLPLLLNGQVTIR